MKKIANKNTMGFTLAEVLITLGIIGVVAAITIPALNNQIQNMQLKTAFKKAYSVASQAWAQVVAENPGTYTGRGGWTCTWPTGESQDYNVADGRSDALVAKMKVTKMCSSSTGCWADTYEIDDGILGWYSGGYNPARYSWVTTDGMCWAAPYKNYDEAHLLVDTNCYKSPNKIGQDIFSMLLGADGKIYFAIDDKAQYGAPVSKGAICPSYNPPYSLNGRSLDFKSWLYN